MTANLAEFIKVFLIVFTFAGGILAFRRFMLSFDEKEEDNKNNKKADVIHLPKRPEVYKKTVVSPDFIDYDGMGNQGRFPKSERK